MRALYAVADTAKHDVCSPFAVYHKANPVQMEQTFARHRTGHLHTGQHLDGSHVVDLQNLTGKNSWIDALGWGAVSSIQQSTVSPSKT
jgi:hypothetical protein